MISRFISGNTVFTRDNEPEASLMDLFRMLGTRVADYTVWMICRARMTVLIIVVELTQQCCVVVHTANAENSRLIRACSDTRRTFSSAR